MGTFLGELKRRKVLRVAAAYIVASWVLLQVADLLASILQLPDWTPRLVFLILVIGFIPALILSWAYDLTPDGVRATPSDDEQKPGNAASTSPTPAIVAGVVILVAVLAGGAWYVAADTRWARNSAMPDIERLVADGELEAAYQLARQVEAILPGDPDLDQIWNTFAWTMSILSNPPGAAVSRKAYADGDAEWQDLGTTPIHGIRIPFGASLLTIEGEDRLPLLRVVGGGLITTTELPVQEPPRAGFATVNPENFQLDTKGSIPPGMVRVPGWSELLGGELVDFDDYFLGQFEVTNREFQEFVDAGGYRRPDLWDHEFRDGARVLSFDEAMALLVDTTGRPGPSTWEGGTYAEEEGDHPVAGVSWYEAAAYARFAGYELPSIHHWRRAFAIATLAWQLPASNLDGDGIAPVGEFRGIGWTGTYDMAGNVREWCFNAVGDQKRAIVGSAWDEDPYMVEDSMMTPHNLDALDRSPTNGFRLAATRDELTTLQRSREAVAEPVFPQPREPVTDEVFAARLSEFDYDDSPLNPVIEESQEFRHWTRQLVSIDNSTSDDRIPVYVYLPRRESTRHQAVLYWPGASAMYTDSVDQGRLELGFALRNGRAVVYPVFNATFERRMNPRPDWSTHAGRNLTIEQVRELRRVIDYLETRADIDTDSLAYFGRSWGGRIGAIVLAVEPRLKVAILNQAGINPDVHPDIDVIDFLPRVGTPVLQFNGLYDTDFRYESSSRPYFERLGTAEPDKRHVVELTGHFVPPAVVKGETLDWLDKYQGPVD